MTDEELKDIVADAMVDDWPDATSINEMIWDRHDDPESLSDKDWDVLQERATALIRTADISVTWPDDEPA